MNNTLYHLDGVTRSYGKGEAPSLACPGLTISRGGVTGIAGPNGSGKSTLLKLLSFVDRPTTGQVFFEGRPEVPFSPSIRHRVTLLPQIPFLLNRSVFDNVAYGLEVKGERSGIGEKVEASLMKVGLDPVRFAKRERHELSGGEAQRVALAARLALEPEVLILDEPTASVDAASTHLIRQAVLSFAEDATRTVILTSHDAAWLSDVSDEMHHLFRGRLVEEKMGLLLFGPFEKGPEGRWFRKGEADLGMAVSEPAGEEAVAALPERHLHIGRGAEKGDVSFKAEVREVSRRAGLSNTRVSLVAGGHAITLSCPHEKAPQPGAFIDVIYAASAQVWL